MDENTPGESSDRGSGESTPDDDAGTDSGSSEHGTGATAGEPPPDKPGDDDVHGDGAPFAADDLAVVGTRERNQQVVGELVVHFRDRDVRVYLDGDSALRLMTCYARRTQIWADTLHPAVSDAAGSVWLTVDPEQVLGMTWVPGLPQPTERLTIDPPVRAA